MRTLPKRAGIATLAFALAFAVGAVRAPAAQAADSAPYRAAVFTRGYDRSAKVVTLTFDVDFWSNANVADVLQTLRNNGITAGFGVTGRFAERYPQDTRAIVAAGHKLINHSYDHPYFTDLTQAQRWSQLDRTETAFRALGLTSSGWFRAPYRDGYTDPGVNRDLALRGYYVNFDWTYDTTGYQGSSQAVILSRVRQYTVPGTIVLMHAGGGSTDPAALPAVISTLRGMGYSFISPYQAATWGAIRAKYLAIGGPARFGAPTTPEMLATTTGTAVQWYQSGRIYWRSGGGTFIVYGAILSKYRSLGTVNSFLKFPLSDEMAVTGGRASRFQGGNIYWSGATGAHEVHGGILSRYLSLGGTGSRLGLPTSDEYTISTGRRSNFQHGAILWNRSTGATTVIYS